MQRTELQVWPAARRVTLSDANTIENRILAYEPERMLAIRIAKAPASFPFKGNGRRDVDRPVFSAPGGLRLGA